MKKIIPSIFLLFGSISVWAQQYGDATLAVGTSQGTFSILYGHDWEFGDKKKFAVGLGGRFTSYFGSNQYYRTAPAELTSGSTGPFVIFKPDIEANIDTFLIMSPQVNSINLLINLRYVLNNRLHLGFNIDAIGFSFGSEKDGAYLNFPEGAVSTAKPTAFNILLISDNDGGSLNSEFYARYFLNKKWALKAGAQSCFTEYTTNTEVQQFPEPNDRFRNKSLMVALGMSVRL
ncbi:MAG: hypothetical protein JNK44_01985 [Cyclobacteriaceae bacterium]|mgnify:CR=1 FL=1|nr:hypothetical protein [Cyclobacteriaceae bacterium]